MSLAFYNTTPGGNWAKEAVVCGHPCELFTAGATDKSGAGFWLWVIDSPVIDANSKPIAVIFVPSNGTQTLDWRTLRNGDHHGRKMRGLYLFASSDPFVRTVIGSEDAYFFSAYETNH